MISEAIRKVDLTPVRPHWQRYREGEVQRKDYLEVFSKQVGLKNLREL
jgi:hypothetical protein